MKEKLGMDIFIKHGDDEESNALYERILKEKYPKLQVINLCDIMENINRYNKNRGPPVEGHQYPTFYVTDSIGYHAPPKNPYQIKEPICLYIDAAPLPLPVLTQPSLFIKPKRRLGLPNNSSNNNNVPNDRRDDTVGTTKIMSTTTAETDNTDSTPITTTDIIETSEKQPNVGGDVTSDRGGSNNNNNIEGVFSIGNGDGINVNGVDRFGSDENKREENMVNDVISDIRGGSNVNVIVDRFGLDKNKTESNMVDDIQIEDDDSVATTTKMIVTTTDSKTDDTMFTDVTTTERMESVTDENDQECQKD